MLIIAGHLRVAADQRDTYVAAFTDVHVAMWDADGERSPFAEHPDAQ